MSNGNPPPECPTGSCGYGAAGGSGDCNGGDSSCANAFLVEGAESGYHTYKLRMASRSINEIFAGLWPDPKDQGRKLSLLRTPRGVAFGWIRHNMEAAPNENYARADDPRVIEELRIVDDGARGEQCTESHCEFSIVDGEAVCAPGSEPTCWRAAFLEAEECDYHPPEIRAATKKIKGLLDSVQAEANGRKLSLLRTPAGLLLAWVRYPSSSAA